MGYSHHYKRNPELNAEAFAKVAIDFKKMMTPLKHLGVVLADKFGENYPIISPTKIEFNGSKQCGHEKKELGITWPSKKASGVSTNKIGQKLQEITDSTWFIGAELTQRVCDGDCSYETFSLEQGLSDNPKWREQDLKAGETVEFTKTAYRPYDLAVNVCLVIAKEHLGKAISVYSDGTIENWAEAMQLCQHFLGYGADFAFGKTSSVEIGDEVEVVGGMCPVCKNKCLTPLETTHGCENNHRLIELRGVWTRVADDTPENISMRKKTTIPQRRR